MIVLVPLVAFLLGVVLGFVACSVLCAAAEADRRSEWLEDQVS